MRKLFLSFIAFSMVFSCFSQKENLRKDIENVLLNKKARTGVAIMDFEGKDTLTINNEYTYPTMSVYKFHISLATLQYVNENKSSLDQQLFIKKSDLLPNTHSPLRDENPNGDFYISLQKIIEYTVSKSDNNGCDILFRFLGGTKMVDNYVKSLGLENTSIQATEEEMHKNFENQYKNYTSPYEAVLLLDMFYNQNILSKENRSFLWKTMVETITGQDKIKAGLPKNAVLGHKTGMSFRNDSGLKAADNDIGIIVLPNGKTIALAVFVSNSMETDETNAKIIADIGKIVWEYYNK